MSLSTNFWTMVKQTPPDWESIETYYDKNKQEIDVDYPREPNQSILLLIFLNKKIPLADAMIHQQPGADFTKTSEKKTMPLLAATAQARAILAHMIDSGQAIDVNSGPVEGLSTYWTVCNYKWWHLAKKIQKKFTVNPGIAPEGCCPPFWLAANARQLPVLFDMLKKYKACIDLTYAPSTGNNKGKQALWFVFDSEDDLRSKTIKKMIQLGAPLQPELAENYRREYDEITDSLRNH